MAGNKRNDPTESKRILDRIARESDPSGSLAVRTGKRVGRHFRADDVDRDDPIELWGTRIGRVIGIVALVVLATWLIAWFSGS
jgi:tetrahydromethanopterin S-methyltransferase subunit G